MCYPLVLLRTGPPSSVLLLLEAFNIIILFFLIKISKQTILILPSLNLVSAVTNVPIFLSQSIHSVAYANFFESSFRPLLASDHCYLLAVIAPEKLEKSLFFSQPPLPPSLDGCFYK